MRLKNYFILCLLISSVNFFEGKTQIWTNISSAWIDSLKLDQTIPPGSWQTYLYGCDGAIVNRLTGDLYINIIKNGIWKSSDHGKTYVRIDQNTVTGSVCPHGMQVDQDDPKRMASFSIDGTAAYTSDGTNWKKMTTVGRNWDFGAIDWSSPVPKVLIAKPHSSSPPLLSIDGGVTWNPMTITTSSTGSMIGIIDSNTFIYSNNNGINRSTDRGATWTKVANTLVSCRVAVMFKGVCYVGTTTGLLVSKDKGATWQSQGSSVDIVQGPWFGANEKEIVIVNKNGVYISWNAGTTWKLLTSLTRGNTTYISIDDFTLTNLFHGCYAWDFLSNNCYVAGGTNAAFRKGPIVIDTVPPTPPTNLTAKNITSSGFSLSWTAPTDNVGVVSYEVVKGSKFYGTTAAKTLNVTNLAPHTTYTIIVKAKDAAGNVSAGSDTLYVTTLSVGLDDVNSTINLYPNPASDYILVDIPENISGSVTIYNVSGRIVAEMKTDSNKTRIDVSSLPEGIYLAKIVSGQESTTRSFVIH